MSIQGNEIRHAFIQISDIVAGVLEENEELKAKLSTADALVTCCCGNPVDSHGMGDGHSPVDQYHYAYNQVTRMNDELKALVRVLLDNDPADAISDGEHTVFDMWRHDARKLLGVSE